MLNATSGSTSANTTDVQDESPSSHTEKQCSQQATWDFVDEAIAKYEYLENENRRPVDSPPNPAVAASALAASRKLPTGHPKVTEILSGAFLTVERMFEYGGASTTQLSALLRSVAQTIPHALDADRFALLERMATEFLPRAMRRQVNAGMPDVNDLAEAAYQIRCCLEDEKTPVPASADTLPDRRTFVRGTLNRLMVDIDFWNGRRTVSH